MNFFEVFISTLILLTNCLPSIKLISGQWCTQQKMVPKTRLQLVPKIEKFWDQNWIGLHVQKTRYRWGYETQQFMVSQTESVCCPGYTERFSDCQPICIPVCPLNSHCSSPNTCKCDTGYNSISSTPRLMDCKPYCPTGCPQNSSCISPYRCACDEGYRTRFDGSCEPICITACPAHSRCTAPGTCSCETGYKPAPDGLECMPQCKNGCPLSMYCKSPDECACRTGYAARIHSRESDEQPTVESSTDECIPVCSEGCPAQSKCVAPEECRCEDSYTMLNENEDDANEVVATNSSICVPVCEQRCPLYASCMRPNECECAPGYEYQHPPQHRPYCQAQCEQNCTVNGKCVAPNVCECFDGYEHVNDTSATNTDAPYCQPKCANGCPYGTCFAPEVCVCSRGYLMGPRQMCEPICTNNCQNGRCVKPEVCACDEGFELSAHDYTKCEPICDRTCINADCAAPDICLCQDKYKPKLDAVSGMMSAHECEPMCMPECVHGDCTAPDQCRCHEGYAPHTNTSLPHICVPQCTRACVNGICLFPDICVCAVDSQLISNDLVNECVPITTTIPITETQTQSSTKYLSTTTTFIAPTTQNEEWFTNGLVAEALTTIADEEHNADEILLPEHNLEKCNELCYCWKEEGKEKEPNELCSEICGIHNEACLDAKFCYCVEAELRLEFRQGALIKRYVCGVNRTTELFKDELSKAEPTWLLISGSILIIVLTVAIAYLCVRIYQTRHETGAHEIPISLLMKL